MPGLIIKKMDAGFMLNQVADLVGNLVDKVGEVYDSNGYDLKMGKDHLTKLIMTIVAPVTMVQDDFQTCDFLYERQDDLQEQKFLTYAKTQFASKNKSTPINRSLTFDQQKILQKWIIQETNAGGTVTQSMLKQKALEICDRDDFVADRTWLKKFTNKYYGIKKLIHEWGPSYEYKKLGKKIKQSRKKECEMSIPQLERQLPTKHNLFREGQQEDIEFI